MDPAGTILVVGHPGASWHRHAGDDGHGQGEWAVAASRLIGDGYRILIARSAAAAAIVFADAHIDLVMVEAGGAAGDALGLVAGLGVSPPAVTRVLVLAADRQPVPQAMARAAIFQFLRQPLDA